MVQLYSNHGNTQITALQSVKVALPQISALLSVKAALPQIAALKSVKVALQPGQL